MIRRLSITTLAAANVSLMHALATRVLPPHFSLSGKSLPSSPLILAVPAVLGLTVALVVSPWDSRAHSPELTPKRLTGFDLHRDDGNPESVWANAAFGAGNKIFACRGSDGAHDSAKDVESLYVSSAADGDNAREPLPPISRHWLAGGRS